MADEGGDLDSWEHQADTGMLDKRLDEMTIEIQQSEDKKKIASRPQVVAEDSSRTQYQPQVRILRRDAKSSPVSNDKKASAQGCQGTSKHTKSLQQREAEYAEARLRIFGSLPPDDDDSAGEEETGSANKSENDNDDAADSSALQKSMPHILKPDEANAQVSVLRQPRGPDGTTGFNKPDHT